MKEAQQSFTTRRGFTLIELLVVIAIIALIMGLLTAAVMRTLGSREDVQNMYDIRQLDEALEKFKNEYKVYPPSQVLLSNDPAQYTSHPLGKQSWAALTKIWPRLSASKSYDWSNGILTNKYAVVLEGDQCLVFFLGGLQTQNPFGSKGFGGGSNNPTDLSGPKVKPFYEFKAAQLYQRSAQHPFFSYKDAYIGQPYVYFASSGGKLGTYSEDDCASLNVIPYFEGWDFAKKVVVPFDAKNPKLGKRYMNPERFQIISAGRNHLFGPGGEWSPTRPIVPAAGEDDQANFHPEMLGTPAQ